MAYRNENGAIRPATTTASTTATGGDADRAVNCKKSISCFICFSFDKLLDKRAIQELIKEIDPMMQIDEEVEDVRYCLSFFFPI